MASGLHFCVPVTSLTMGHSLLLLPVFLSLCFLIKMHNLKLKKKTSVCCFEEERVEMFPNTKLVVVIYTRGNCHVPTSWRSRRNCLMSLRVSVCLKVNVVCTQCVRSAWCCFRICSTVTQRTKPNPQRWLDWTGEHMGWLWSELWGEHCNQCLTPRCHLCSSSSYWCLYKFDINQVHSASWECSTQLLLQPLCCWHRLSFKLTEPWRFLRTLSACSYLL